MTDHYQTLIAAAIRAPSGDNTQPWRFSINRENGSIAIYLDETRDPSPMNSGQRMARLAIGAALENILHTAASNGWKVEVAAPPRGRLAMVQVVCADSGDAEMAPCVATRLTNRRAYDRRLVPPNVQMELRRQTPESDGVRTHWIFDRDRVVRLAGLIGRSDAFMLSDPTMRRAFLDNIRFDAPARASVNEGMPLASLELRTADRAALRMMRWIPNWLLRIGGAAGKFAAAGRHLVESASGLCFVAEPDGAAESEVLAGRAAERAWLTLTAHGCAAQPMMSLAILENLLRQGSPNLLASLDCEGAAALLEEYHELVPEIKNENTAFIMRFGYAAPPTAVTGRLPTSSNVTETSIAQRGDGVS